MNIKRVLMERDGLDEADAERIISELRETLNERLLEGDIDGAYNVCEEVGLEPDYLEDLS